MPELPEVETVVRGLRPFLKGQKFDSILCRSPSLRFTIPVNQLRDLQGIKIHTVERRAKYILIECTNAKTIVAHLGMTGSFTVFPSCHPDTLDMDRHDHLVLTTMAGDCIVYRDPRRFGSIDVIDTSALSSYKPLAHLGVEPLSDEFTGASLQKLLASRSLAIKPALMNQQIVVGVGNIYASEALFLSSIHPEQSSASLTRHQCNALVYAIKDVLTRAIESGGSTLRDYRRVGGEAGSFQFDFSVYDKEREACPDCTCSLAKTGGIQRIVQAGRSTFFCPKKQRRKSS